MERRVALDVTYAGNVHPTELFTTRVDDYVRYRPSYPATVLDEIRVRSGLTSGSPVADVGAGTGIFSRLLLGQGFLVTAVEPNDAMRQAAEAELSGQDGYRSVKGTAEDTGVLDRSQEAVTCAQSFHWFDRVKAREEFRRILKPGGWVALVWNERARESNPFLDRYDEILRDRCPDYEKVQRRQGADEGILDFFHPGTGRLTIHPNEPQTFDFEGFVGRVMSASYAPQTGHPAHEAFLEALRRLYEKHEDAGLVQFPYETKLFLGQV